MAFSNMKQHKIGIPGRQTLFVSIFVLLFIACRTQSHNRLELALLGAKQNRAEIQCVLSHIWTWIRMYTNIKLLDI